MLNSTAVTISPGLCELGDIRNKIDLHRKGAILRQIYKYSLIYMHANGTGAARSGSAVCVLFACISLFAPALLIARYFFLSFAQV